MPATTLLHEMEYGAVVAIPIRNPLAKNSTLEMEPSRSVALAVTVSVAGEVVTASLYTSHRGATHVRLIPMGVGYRYAGRGIWLDGFRENALLNFGKYNQIACTIAHS